MRGNFVVTAGPLAEPISLAEAKNHCRVDDDITADDARISGLILAARQRVESVTGRLLVTRTVKGYWPNFYGRLDLMAPLRAVNSLTYMDSAGATQTLDADDYVVDPDELPGVIVPAYQVAWPTTRDHPKAVCVTFAAGYATAFTADATTDTLTAKGHPYANGDTVRLTNSGGALPGGLSSETDYYARDVAGDTLKLAATPNGAAINITGAGAGMHFLGEIERQAIEAMKLHIELLYRPDPAYAKTLESARDALLESLKVWSV